MATDESSAIAGRIVLPREGRSVGVPSAGGAISLKAEAGDTGGLVRSPRRYSLGPCPPSAPALPQALTDSSGLIQSSRTLHAKGVV
jgi:hypothetical protein